MKASRYHITFSDQWHVGLILQGKSVFSLWKESQMSSQNKEERKEKNSSGYERIAIQANLSTCATASLLVLKVS